MAIEDIAAWHGFAAAMVGAAAVLAGLVFLGPTRVVGRSCRTLGAEHSGVDLHGLFGNA